MIDNSLSYTEQLSKAISKMNQKSAWILHTFYTRKPEFLRTMWRSLIQCHLDYGCVLWAPYPSQKGKLLWMESTLRSFTKKASNLSELDYWSRLKKMSLNSVQRRVERFRIIYSWKSLHGLSPSLGMEWNPASGSGRSGRALLVPGVKGNTACLSCGIPGSSNIRWPHQQYSHAKRHNTNE